MESVGIIAKAILKESLEKSMNSCPDAEVVKESGTMASREDLVEKVLLLWKRMMGIYGTQWASQFGEYPSREWFDALVPFSWQILEMALGRCCQRESYYPPNLPEFLSICRWCRDDCQREMEYRESLKRPKIEDAGEELRRERMGEFMKQFGPIMVRYLERGLSMSGLQDRCRTLFDAGESLDPIRSEVGL